PLAPLARQDHPPDDPLPGRGGAALRPRRRARRRPDRRPRPPQRTDRRGPCDRDPLPAQRPRDRRPDLRADARPARADRRGAGRRRRARGAERPPADARGDLPVAYGKRARVRLFLHQLRGEQRLYWRSRELAFFTFIFPLLIFVLLGSVYGHDKIKSEGNVKGSSYLLAGVLGYGVAATALGGLAIWLVI